MIGVEDLVGILLAEAGPLPTVILSVADAVGATLAEPIVAVEPLPPFANSAMDGFAVRGADLSSVDHFLIVAGLPAGRAPSLPLLPGQAAVIATGAPLPPGADVVVPVEQSAREGDRVRLSGPVPAHGHIRPAGEDVAPGTLMADRGVRLSRPLTILAAAAGVSRVAVFPIPRIGVLTTGDELVALRAPLAPAAVRDVNGPLLAHFIESIGLTAVSLGRSSDDPVYIADQLAVLDHVDAVIVSGGLGLGERDVVVEALTRRHTATAFQVAMRPGKAFAVGRVGDRPVFCLPGNPGAALAAFYALVAPPLRSLAGRPAHPPVVTAELTRPIINNGGRRHYVRATLARDGPTLAATPTGRQGSGLVSDIVAADALLVIPETVERAEAGDVVQVLPLNPLGGP